MPLPSKRNFEITNEGVFLVKVRPEALTKELSQMLPNNYVVDLGNRLLGTSTPLTNLLNLAIDTIDDLIGDVTEKVKDILDNGVKDVSTIGKEVFNAVANSFDTNLFYDLDPSDRISSIYDVFNTVSILHEQLMDAGDTVFKELKPYVLTQESYKELAAFKNKFADLDRYSPSDLLRASTRMTKSEFDWFFKTTKDYMRIAMESGQMSEAMTHELYRIFVETPMRKQGTNLIKVPVISDDKSLAGLVTTLQSFYKEDDPAKISPLLINYRDPNKDYDPKDNDPAVSPEPKLTIRVMQEVLRYIEEEYNELLTLLLPNDTLKLATIARHRSTLSSILFQYKFKLGGVLPKVSVSQEKLNDIAMHLNTIFANDCLGYFLTDSQITLNGRWRSPYEIDTGSMYYYPVDRLYAELRSAFTESLRSIAGYIEFITEITELTDFTFYYEFAIRYKASTDITCKCEVFSYLMSPILTTLIEHEDERLFEVLDIAEMIFSQSRYATNFFRKTVYRAKSAAFSDQLSSKLDNLNIVV